MGDIRNGSETGGVEYGLPPIAIGPFFPALMPGRAKGGHAVEAAILFDFRDQVNEIAAKDGVGIEHHDVTGGEWAAKAIEGGGVIAVVAKEAAIHPMPIDRELARPWQKRLQIGRLPIGAYSNDESALAKIAAVNVEGSSQVMNAVKEIWRWADWYVNLQQIAHRNILSSAAGLKHSGCDLFQQQTNPR